MAETHVDPLVTAALQSVLQERGWTLASDGGNGVFSAEPQSALSDQMMIAAATPDGLVRALDAFDARLRATKPGWRIPVVVVTGTLDVDKEDTQ